MTLIKKAWKYLKRLVLSSLAYKRNTYFSFFNSGVGMNSKFFTTEITNSATIYNVQIMSSSAKT